MDVNVCKLAPLETFELATLFQITATHYVTIWRTRALTLNYIANLTYSANFKFMRFIYTGILGAVVKGVLAKLIRKMYLL